MKWKILCTSVNIKGEYAPQGAIRQLTYGGSSGIVEGVLFNSRLQPTQISASHGGANFLTLGYTYGTTNNNGNVQTHTFNSDAARTQTFGYDALNRLQSAVESGGWTQNYAYDRYGNRAVLAGSWIPIANATPTVADLLPSTVEAQFPLNRWLAGLTYDTSGLVTTSGTQTYTYDGENRLKTAQSGGVTTSYDYDGDGRRVQKVDGYGTTRYVYDAQGKLAVENYTAASGVTQPSTFEIGTRYLIRDHLGSTRATTDAAAATVRYFDYLPFGEDIAQGNYGRGTRYPAGSSLTVPGNVTERFTGKERDVETGLDYFEARYLSAAQGRFTSVDPVSGGPGDPQSWNMYAYARNNPLLYTDPDGQTYRICDTSGHCDDNYTDANFDKNLSGTAKNGSIFDKEGNKIGSYQRTSFDDLSGFGNSFFNQMSARRQASNQFIGAFAVGSVALGTGGALAVNAAGLTAGAGLTTVNLQGAAQAAALALPAGAKLGQMIARSGNTQFIGNPQAFLSFARDFVVTAVKQGSYAAGDYISKGGSTIYRVGNDFMTVARDGRILSYVQGANTGGVAAKYSQLGGK